MSMKEMKVYVVMSMKPDYVFHRLVEELERISVVVELEPDKVNLGHIKDMSKEANNGQDEGNRNG